MDVRRGLGTWLLFGALGGAACSGVQDVTTSQSKTGNGGDDTEAGGGAGDTEGGGGAGPSGGGQAGASDEDATGGEPIAISSGGTGSGDGGETAGGTTAGGTASGGSGSGGTASGGSSGTASGGSGGVTCPQYSGTLAKDSVIFDEGYGESTTGSWSGNAFTYKYGTATIAPGMGNKCFAGAMMCANGSIPADDASGAGLGWYIAQPSRVSAHTKVAITTPVVIKLAGAKAGMRVQLSASSTEVYCYTLTAPEVAAGSVTIPAKSFKKECWDTATAVAYGGTPIEFIEVGVPGAMAAASTFDFCILDIEPG